MRAISLRSLPAGLGAGFDVPPLGDARAFAGAPAQVVELGAPDDALAHHGDAVDVRRVQREDALDALAEADLAHREVRADALVRAGDAHPFVGLDAGALAL